MKLNGALSLSDLFQKHPDGQHVLLKAVKTTDGDFRWVAKLEPQHWRQSIVLFNRMRDWTPLLDKDEVERMRCAVEECALALAES